MLTLIGLETQMIILTLLLLTLISLHYKKTQTSRLKVTRPYPLHADNKVSDWYINHVVSPCFNIENWSCLVNTNNNNNVLVPENLVLNLSEYILTPTQISVLVLLRGYLIWGIFS